MRFKRIEYDIAAMTIEKARAITAIRIGKHRPIPPRQGRANEFANSGRFAGARGPNHLEMLGLVEKRYRYAG